MTHMPGHIERKRLKSGQIRYYPSVAPPLGSPPGTKRVRLPPCDTEEKAEGLIAGYMAQRSNTAHGASLLAYAPKWLDRRELDGEHRATHQVRSLVETHILTAELARWPMRRIDRQDVVAFMRALKRKPAVHTITRGRGSKRRTEYRETGRTLSYSVRRQTLSALRCILQDAADEGLVPRNAAFDVRLRKEAREDEGWTYLTLDEIAMVLGLPRRKYQGHAHHAYQRDALTVAVYQGLRQGELWGLRWRDVDLEAGQLHVRRSYAGPTKGGKPRTVPMLPQVHSALTARRVRQPGIGDALVFPGRGGAMRAKGYDVGWAKHMAPLFARRVRFHDLRHTAATQLLVGGYTPKPLRMEQVQQMLGHSNITVTQRYARMVAAGLPTLAEMQTEEIEWDTERTV